MSGLNEECGVFGVYSPSETAIADTVYYGLYALQHRGQESCGIVVCSDGVYTSHKDLGLVGEVFTPRVMESFPKGTMAVGHVRYGTTGGTNRANCQPIEVNHQKGKMALAHNGNLSNAYDLRAALELDGAIFHTTSDTEIIAYLVTRERLSAPSVEVAVERAMNRLEGAYSLVILSATKMIAVRDPHGFRPLCFGKRPDGAYIVASESCALHAVGAEFIRDVRPGEVLVFDRDNVFSLESHCGKVRHTPCIFEYIYFSRPDSIVDGISVHKARLAAGRILAKRCPVDADVVIGVPDSGLDAALGYSAESGIPYGIGFVKNRYIGRTFIAPGQDNRLDKVRIKLNPVRETVEGKRVVMIDDSIVRGTTCGRIIGILRAAGAREIHMRVSAPPFLYPCYYGTDIDSSDNLIAFRHSTEEIAALIGADSLGYLPYDALSELIDGKTQFCSSCFDGIYPTPVPSVTQKDRFEEPLSRRKKKDGE